MNRQQEYERNENLLESNRYSDSDEEETQTQSISKNDNLGTIKYKISIH